MKLEIGERIQKYLQSPSGYTVQLKMDIARIVSEYLIEHRITQKDFASRIHMHESQISRILEADQNCTLTTLGRIFYGIGQEMEIRPRTRAIGKITADHPNDTEKKAVISATSFDFSSEISSRSQMHGPVTGTSSENGATSFVIADYMNSRTDTEEKAIHG